MFEIMLAFAYPIIAFCLAWHEMETEYNDSKLISYISGFVVSLCILGLCFLRLALDPEGFGLLQLTYAVIVAMTIPNQTKHAWNQLKLRNDRGQRKSKAEYEDAYDYDEDFVEYEEAALNQGLS